MIAYMIIKVGSSIGDTWVEIVEEEFASIEEAEEFRDLFLQGYPDISADNVSVVQYRI